MTIFDLVSLVVIAVLAIRGMFLGFLEEFSGKAGVIIGIICAAMFTGPLTQAFSPLIIRTGVGSWGSVIIFVVLVGLGFLVTRFFLGVVGNIFEAFNMTVMDHFIGMAFGALEGAIAVIVFIYLLRMQNFIDRSLLLDGSALAEYFTPFLLWAIKFDVGEYARQFMVR